MAEILTRTYTYTGKSGWTAGASSVPFSSFAVSGDTRPITQILSIGASWYRYHDTSSTVAHTADLAFASGAVFKSNAVSQRGDGDIFRIDAIFTTMPAAADWVESGMTLRTTLSTKQEHVFWTATAERPMVVTITYTSSEFKPSISAAKLYRANSLGAAADDGTYLTFTATLAVEKTGTSGSGVFTIYSGDSPATATTQVYRKSGIAGSTGGVVVSQAPISGVSVGSGEKKWYRMEFSYTALTETGASSTEAVAVAFLIGNVFTNVHLARASTGGVRFGGYSTATEGNPKFECDYPAYLYGGIAQIGDGSGDLLALIGVQHGNVSSMTLTGSTTNTLEVNFPRAFASAPDVVATFDSSSISSFSGRWDYLTLTVYNITATGFTLRVHNGTSTTFTPGLRWIAVGVPAN